MSDVLLINPNTLNIPVSKQFERYEQLMFKFAEERELIGLARGTTTPPTAMLSIAAVLKKNGISVAVLDLTVECYNRNDSRKKMLSALKRENPKIVGINGMEICLLSQLYKIAEITKEFNKDILVVTGGVNATAMFKEILENPNVDLVIMGEGEETFLELCKAVLVGEGVEEIDGISFRKNGKIHQTKERKFINLDEIPLPDRDAYPLAKLYSLNGGIDVIFASRGCRYNCSFCNAPGFWKHRWRGKSPTFIAEELRDIEDRGGKIAHVYDLNFGTDKKWVKEICREIKKNKLNIRWDCELRISDFNRSFLKVLRDANCQGIFSGIETPNQSVLNSVRKSYDIAILKIALLNAKRLGIHVDGGFIFGLPEDDAQGMKEISSLACELLDQELLETPAPFLFVPFRGTEIGDNPQKFGIDIVNKNYDDWHFFPQNPITSTKTTDAKTVYKEHITCLENINKILESRV